MTLPKRPRGGSASTAAAAYLHRGAAYVYRGLYLDAAIGRRPLADRGGVHLRDGAVLGGEGAGVTGEIPSDLWSDLFPEAGYSFVIDLRVLRDLPITPMRPLGVLQKL
jgi:hypothetical protein